MDSRSARPVGDRWRWVPRAVQLAQRLMCAVYVALSLLGILFTPPMLMLIAVPAVGIIAAALLAALYRYCEQRGPSRRTVTVTAGTAALIVPFNESVQLLGRLGTAIAVILLVLLTAVSNYWVHGPLQVPAAADGAGPGGTTSYEELLRVVPLETVLTEWRAVSGGVALSSDEQRSSEVAQVRAHLLDEMQRRDPVGFARWLEAGAGDPPERHIQGDQGLAA